jgi:signal transduction histidine kinase
METNSASNPHRADTPPQRKAGEKCRLDLLSKCSELGETRLLLDAFETFTQASSSLESAYQQLQQRAQRLSEELAAKNQELEQSLREKEEVQNHLARILESLPCGVLVMDHSGTVTLCNPVATQILEVQEPTDDCCEPGSPGPGIVITEYLAAAESHRNLDEEIEIPIVSAGKMRVLATSATPLRSAAGEGIGTLHIIRDVTELKALEEQNNRGARLSAMGEMAVELAHEIRNPLGSIELFASLLEKELPRDSDPGRWAENIRIGSRSLNNIVSNMLHFANPLSATFSDVELHDITEEIIRFAEPILSQREVRIERTLEAQSAIVSGDRELLKQMILNLVLNALQAMPSHGALYISTLNVTRLPGGALCDGLELRIRDTGLGIPPEHLDRIFDPFFTTNKSGTGLGLSVVHQIVDQHSGFINVESEQNVGTTFRVILPSARVISGAA